jgi:hypothetical protein
MKRNDGLDFAPGNLFTDGDPLVPTLASVLGAAWLNMVQEEIVNAVVMSGIALDGNDDEQLYQAIVKQITDRFAGAFKVYAGNPNTFVAGTQGNAGTGVFPTVCWDTTNKIWWVCTTTGNAAAAVWEVVGDQPAWPFWCGTSAGTADAPVLVTPAEMTGFATGTSIAWKIGVGPNTGAVNVTVGAFGAWPLHKDGPGGPVALVGGELDVNNLCTARFDGAVLHLVSTELGTAALADASSNTGKVAAVSGPTVVGNLPEFTDTFGTVADSGTSTGGLAGSAEAVMYRLGLSM